MTPSIFYSVKSEDEEYVDIDDRHAKATVKAGKAGVYDVEIDLKTFTVTATYAPQ